MSAHVTTPQVLDRKHNEARITCPSCHTTRVVDVTKYRSNKGPVKAKCGCGCVFSIQNLNVELRKFRRKETNLPGSYSRTDRDKKGFIRVKNISYSGIGFEIEGDDTIELNDVLGVKCLLDDDKKTEINRTVVVKHVDGRYIGAEFCDTQIFDLDLCYYLMLS